MPSITISLSKNIQEKIQTSYVTDRTVLCGFHSSNASPKQAEQVVVVVVVVVVVTNIKTPE